MNYRRIVPNSISAFSLMLGLLSIFHTVAGDFFWAPVCIILSVIADSLDGRAARLLRCQGDFGKELDSLCDLAAFGVAPAVMIYYYGLKELGLAGMVVASLFTVFGALRLARFNVNTASVHGYFQGMPIPAGACFLAAYVLSGYRFAPLGAAAMTLVVALILYSEIKFPDFKGRDGMKLYPLPIALGVAVGLFLLWQRPFAWPFAAMCAYTLGGILNSIYAYFRKERR